MLTRLSIRDIVLIEKLDLDMEAGLSVLTGETGAGKSILLDAFALALGARGDGGLVRNGKPQGQVVASFELPSNHAVRALLGNHSIAADSTIILRRAQFADGRSRAFVNDEAVSVQILRQIGDSLVEIHGQHDDRAMVEIASHRRLLDAFGRLDREVSQLAALHSTWRAATLTLSQHRLRVETARSERDWLKHAAEELAKLAVEVGEETSLAERRSFMMQSEKIAVDLSESHQAISGPDSPVPAIAAIMRRLDRRSAMSPSLVEPAIAALDRALGALDDARLALETAMREANFDPRDLERTEERLFALRAASRKYDKPVDVLPALGERYAADLALIDAGETELGKLEEAERLAELAFRKAAVELSDRRKQAAAALEMSVNAELPPLKLERARFSVSIQTDVAAPTADGIDRIEFWVQTNPGTRPGPLMKIASGGELSRFLLAIKVALADRGSAPTLVFDEIDSGAGGAVADAIGARLKRLAERVQVIGITHAPQVAARAATHLLIAKQTADEHRVATFVSRLDPAARREEIARMLSGAAITSEARKAAESLIASA